MKERKLIHRITNLNPAQRPPQQPINAGTSRITTPPTASLSPVFAVLCVAVSAYCAIFLGMSGDDVWGWEALTISGASAWGFLILSTIVGTVVVASLVEDAAHRRATPAPSGHVRRISYAEQERDNGVYRRPIIVIPMNTSPAGHYKESNYDLGR